MVLPTQSTSGEQNSNVVRMKFSNTHSESEVTGGQFLPGKANYLKGNNPDRWLIDIPTFKTITYTELYPGIDVIFYGNQRVLEFDFIVAPGANPEAITLDIEGAEKLEKGQNGDLKICLSEDYLLLRKPSIYQMTDSEKKEIIGSFHLLTHIKWVFNLNSMILTKPLLSIQLLSIQLILEGQIQM